ncbi:hypothetical protein VP1G_11116 [Cytospora mali]|uniref:Uncharacterized protein n=1 Tax=Cytospora mali TaxID=578113 RepID=A0A194V675_CYTMA|nr:hypothetical protein VP1G_11116 [Valsa mali var. pyri (nom. inval.)]
MDWMDGVVKELSSAYPNGPERVISTPGQDTVNTTADLSATPDDPGQRSKQRDRQCNVLQTLENALKVEEFEEHRL